MNTSCLAHLPASAQPDANLPTAMPRYSDGDNSSLLAPAATSSIGFARDLAPTALADLDDHIQLASFPFDAANVTDCLDDKDPAFSWAFSSQFSSFPQAIQGGAASLPFLTGATPDPTRAAPQIDFLDPRANKVSSWLEDNSIAANPSTASPPMSTMASSTTASLARRSSGGNDKKRRQDSMEPESPRSLARVAGMTANGDASPRSKSPKVDRSASVRLGNSARGSAVRSSSSSGRASGKGIHRVRSQSDIGQHLLLSGQHLSQGSSASLDVPGRETPFTEHRGSLDFEPMFEGDDEDNCSSGSGAAAGLRVAEAPAAATPEAFRAHVRALNPRLEPAMVDRITVEQLKRYKRLLDCRSKHDAAVAGKQCPSGSRCGVLGDGPNYKVLPSKASDGPVALFHIVRPEGSTGDEGGDDAGTSIPASFPEGIPIPPVSRLPAEFECPLCFQVKRFVKPSDWTKHVHEDVQPFTCTFAKCGEPKSFKRKADWVRHESERHRHLESWRCDVPECSHTCYRKDNFVQHLVREHRLPEPRARGSKGASRGSHGGDEDRVGRLVQKCRVESSRQSTEEPCRFCGSECNSWKKLTVHLAKHMEQISMPILELIGHRLPRFDGFAVANSSSMGQVASPSITATGSGMGRAGPSYARSGHCYSMGPAISVTNSASESGPGRAHAPGGLFRRRADSLGPDDMSIGRGAEGPASLLGSSRLSSSSSSSPPPAPGQQQQQQQGESLLGVSMPGTPFSGSLQSTTDMRRFSGGNGDVAMADPMLQGLTGMDVAPTGRKMESMFQPPASASNGHGLQIMAAGSWQQQQQQQHQAMLSQMPANMGVAGYPCPGGFQQPHETYGFGVGANTSAGGQAVEMARMPGPRETTAAVAAAWMERAWPSKLYDDAGDSQQQQQQGGQQNGGAATGWESFHLGGY